jgi:hypothetical protein
LEEFFWLASTLVMIKGVTAFSVNDAHLISGIQGTNAQKFYAESHQHYAAPKHYKKF